LAENNSNAEKQARYRRKEALKKYAQQMYREWEARAGFSASLNRTKVRSILEKAADLPSGWTDEDYEAATKTINQVILETYDNPHALSNDVQDGRDSWNKFKTTPDPLGFTKEMKAAIEKAQKLSAHLIAALELSNCSVSDQAAVIMEVMRFIGSSLISSRVVPRSDATAMCLASLGPQYEKPDWLIEDLARKLGWNFNKELANVLGKKLQEFNYEHRELE
jgi:hypothetical protein